MKIVMITREAEALRDAIVADTPSPITYDADKPEALLAEDKIVEKLPLKIPAANVKIVMVEEVFAS